ncbi:MAG: hypothetical protein R3B72_28650 [Polyangiaceae bacterium]
MRRKRYRGDTKVWHDPLMVPAAARHDGNGSKAAEALNDGEENGGRRRRLAQPKRTGAKIVAGPVGPTDPRELERERLLDRILHADGRPGISRAIDDFVGAGFELPRSQSVWLQALEHHDESRVVEAIGHLSDILDAEEPQRRAVLESRLRRIEEYADDSSAQSAAGRLIRLLKDKHAETLG